MKLKILFLLLVLVSPLIIAQQTVKTIEFPLGYNATVPANMREYYNISLTFPDGVETILSMELQVQGDFLANTNVRVGLKGKSGVNNNCDPNPWIIATMQKNYELGFDCTSLANQERWKGRDVEFFTRFTKNASHVRASLKVTYLNSPNSHLSMLGTEYNPVDNATTFLQLIDSLGSYVDNATCDLTIYYPTQLGTNSSKFLDNVPMTFIERGIYEFNYAAPTTLGVYKVSALCEFEDIGRTFNIPFTTSFDGSLFDDSLGDRSEVEFSDCVFMKTESSTFQQFDFVDAGIANLNASNLDAILGVWIGQNDKDLSLQIRDFTNSEWDTMPGGIISSSTGSSGTCGESHGGSRLISTDLEDYIGGVADNEIWLRLFGASGKILTDDIELRVRSTQQAVNDIRGAGEVHIKPKVWEDAYTNNRTITGVADNVTIPASINNTELVDDVWNYSGTITSNILDQIATTIWAFSDRVLTFFDFPLQGTYVWNTTDRELTNFTINETSIANATWNFDARYTHGIIIP